MKKRIIAILAMLVLLGVSLRSEEKELLILVTNDDGIESPSLSVLAKEMTKLGRVIVAAPKTNQSGTSHIIRGYITVTPHIVYQTDFSALEKTKALFEEKGAEQR
jgi:hypothetical protein